MARYGISPEEKEVKKLKKELNKIGFMKSIVWIAFVVIAAIYLVHMGLDIGIAYNEKPDKFDIDEDIIVVEEILQASVDNIVFADDNVVDLEAEEMSEEEKQRLEEEQRRAEALAYYGEMRPVYKVQNPGNEEFVLTTSTGERQRLLDNGWYDWGIAWYAPSNGSSVYRLLNPEGVHHFTVSEEEKNYLVQQGWICEGEVFKSEGPDTVYRLYNESNMHVYTINVGERDSLISQGWIDETNNAMGMQGFIEPLQ